MENARKYIRIMRLDHWIKQLFILPGLVASLFLTHTPLSWDLVRQLCVGFFATCLIASANYVINEWLDAKFDKFHPVKKNRSVVSGNLKTSWIIFEYIVFALVGFGLAILSSGIGAVFYMEAWLFIMGIIYNVRPVRTKEIPYLDVLSESINNAIRLLMGWFIASGTTIPPSSLLLGYWMAGAFLMATKRYAEYRMIGDRELAGKYRKSFRYYTEESLLVSAFFYAMCSVFFL